jgi:hypothetical protein
MIDVGVGRRGTARQQGGCHHDLAGLAITALGGLFGDPCVDHAIPRLRRQAFDGNNAFAGHLRKRGHASAHRFAVSVNGANAANPDTAPVFGPSEPEIIAKRPKQGHLRRSAHLTILAVYVQPEHACPLRFGRLVPGEDRTKIIAARAPVAECIETGMRLKPQMPGEKPKMPL